jgi:hypothetical protein
MTVMFDSNIYDELDADLQAMDFLTRLISNGQVQLFITGVQINQIRNIPNNEKRNRLQSLLNILSPIKLFVEYAPYGYAYGECYGGLSPDSILDHNKFITSNSHIEDAMIAATASSNKYKLDYIVTNDNKFKKKLKSQTTSTRPINFIDFLELLKKMAT